mgnify:CR=1 FL=1
MNGISSTTMSSIYLGSYTVIFRVCFTRTAPSFSESSQMTLSGNILIEEKTHTLLFTFSRDLFEFLCSLVKTIHTVIIRFAAKYNYKGLLPISLPGC